MGREAKVYYSVSDIIGLHIEAVSLDEFEDMTEVAPGLVMADHVSRDELAPEDLIPAILWQRPSNQACVMWSMATIQRWQRYYDPRGSAIC